MTSSDPDRERRVREHAYELWVAEGRPDGRAEAHWREACETVDGSSALSDVSADDAPPAAEEPTTAAA